MSCVDAMLCIYKKNKNTIKQEYHSLFKLQSLPRSHCLTGFFKIAALKNFTS